MEGKIIIINVNQIYKYPNQKNKQNDHNSNKRMHELVTSSRGGGMYKGEPQNSEIFLNIYTIILIFLKFSLQK